jgi:hypothetical protein
MSEQLQEKIDELELERGFLADAQKRMDVDAEIATSQRVSILKGQIERLRREQAQAHIDAVTAKAKERHGQIPTEVQDVVDAMADQLALAKAAKQAYENELARLNELYVTGYTLAAEANALRDRFNLPKEPLPSVPVPAHMGFLPAPSVALALPMWLGEQTEDDEHRLRTRRTYTEVRGTEGYALIEAVGLKQFPNLTPKQQDALDQQRKEREQNFSALSNEAVIGTKV